MPDFERPLRSLELHLARTPGEKAYVRGKHDGRDIARKQVVKLLPTVLTVLLIFDIFRIIFG